MTTSKKVGKTELVTAVIVVVAGLWYVWPSNEVPASNAGVTPTKTPTVAVATTAKPAIANIAPVQHKQSTANALKEDQDVLDEYYHLAHAAQGDNPDGSDCANQALGYVYNYQGAQDSHNTFVRNPQQAVASANKFARENPSLNWPQQTVEDAPEAMLKADKRTLADAVKWFEKHGCRT